MEITFEIEGIEETFAELDKLPAIIRGEAGRKALQAASGPVLATLEPRIPIGSTGDLKAALQSQTIQADDGSGYCLEVDFGEQNRIAQFIEDGHRQVSHKGKETGFVRARPFIQPSLETATPELVEAYYETLMNALVQESEIVSAEVPNLPVEL
jgi:hypothetical protein